MRKNVRLNFLLISGLLALNFIACSKKSAVDPQSDDLADLRIDPDQKALPAQVGNDSISAIKPTTAETTDSSVVPPTPTAQELNSAGESVVAEAVEPEPPLQRNIPEPSDAGEVTGTGPQIRYIKAAELNIRQEPNRYSKIVGRLLGGAKVRVKIQGGWARLDEDRWIRSRWLVKSPPKNLMGSDEDASRHSKPSSSKKKGKKTSKKRKSH